MLKKFRCEEIGPHRLYLGDCREILPLIGAVDAVVTDPPYGIRHASGHARTWKRKEIANDHDTSTRDHVAEWAAAASIPSVFFGTWKTAPVRNSRGCIAWDKGPGSGMGDLSFPWKLSFELAYISGKGWSSKHRGEGVLRGSFVVNAEDDGRLHPHQKPVWLLEHFIERIPEAQTILDPFMGSGTTGVACLNQRRSFVGIEIDERHFEAAAKRISEAMKQEKLPF